MKRILITGSRGWTDWQTIEQAIQAERNWNEVAVIVHGACPTGADDLADRVAANLGLARECHPADWDQHGRSAGPIRNQEMVALGADVCLAFISPCTSPRCKTPGRHPSHGASLTAKLAEQAGIPTRRFMR